MSLYVVKTFRETPPAATDVAIRLRDGRAMVVPAYISNIRKIYAQYELDVGGMGENDILSVKGKKTRFVGPSEKECSGPYRVGESGLLVVVPFDGKTAICDIPKYAIIAIEGERGEEVLRCGRYRGIEGYEVEYRACLPEGITPQDIASVR